MSYLTILSLVVSFIAVLVVYSKWRLNYWDRRNLRSVRLRRSVLFRKEAIGDIFKRMYNELKGRGLKHGGVVSIIRQVYMPVDLEYIKNILQRDFQYFSDRGIYYNEKDDPLSAHLFAVDTVKWRKLRTRLTPTFTSGKMKLMFPLILESTKPMLSNLEEYAKSGDVIDIKDLLGNFTTDVIGTCAFGLDCNSFVDPDSNFRKYGKRIFTLTQAQALLRIFRISFQDLARFLHIRVLDKEVADFFLNMSKSTIEYRKKNEVLRNDFVNLLMNINKTEELLTSEEMAAQMFVFFLAGFETSATTMSYALYELSKYPEVQKQAREEVKKVLEQHNGNLTYEAVYDMKYLGGVVDETLRLHPPVPTLNRKCTRDYQVPGTEVILEKGTAVNISLYGLHYDEEHFPEPEIFKPERFLEENKDKIKPFTYLPFGDGPRNCIGLRFGIMQSKVGLAVLLSKYEFVPNPKTEEPLILDPLSFLTSAKGGIWLNARKISTA